MADTFPYFLAMAQLGKLVAEFDAAIAEKNAVEAEAEKCQRKLDLAQRLMRSLGSEGTRWAQTIDELKEQVRKRRGEPAANVCYRRMLCISFPLN